IPDAWDGPATFPGGRQMSVGESLIYSPGGDPSTPGAGHLWQFVSTASTPAGWADVGLVRGPEGVSGAPGAAGATGATGADGPTGAPGPRRPPGALSPPG